MRTVGRTLARAFAGLLVVGRRRSGRRLYSFAGLVACAVAALSAFALSPAAGSGASATPQPDAEVSVVRELPELRTETSDTFLRSDGLRSVRISKAPVNYRDSSGNWQPISTTLQSGPGGSLSSTATILPASLPASLSSPVTVGSGGQTVSFALEGAGGTVSSSGSSASYAEALPNAKASYEEQATRLSETLSLANASAPSVYHYHLSTTGGVTAKLLDGAVVFSDAQGHPRYVMPPPTVANAGQTGRPDAKDVHYTLSEDGSQLAIVVDSAWLSSPERAFPVTIDPTTEYWGDNVDCFIASEPPGENTSLCGWYFYLGYHTEGSSHSIGRGLLRFELGSSIPKDATILSANLRLTDSFTATSSQTIEVAGLEKTPTNSATWNKYDGTNAWTKPGGDSEPAENKQTIAPTGSGYKFSWGITALVERWLHEPSSNHGMLLKAENETSSGGESSWISDSGEEHPYIEVNYSPKIGAPSDQTLSSQALGDRQSLGVDVANGNVLMQNHILELPGIGFDLSLNATYNNLEYSWRSLGMGTILSTGEDIRMEYNESEGSWAYADPSGTWYRFQREPAGDKEGKKAFLMPYGLNAKLTEEASGELVLEYLTAKIKYYFNNNKHPSYLQKIEDANKNTETLHYSSGHVSSIEDTHGHTITFTGSGGYVTSLKDSLGRKWEFAQNSKGQLETIKDPGGHKSKYTYNEADDLTQIEDPDGHLVELSYNWLGGVSEIRHVVNGTASKAGSKDVITTFNYTKPAKSSLSCPAETVGDTEVVSPDGSPGGIPDSSASGHQTFYCFNNADQVTKTIDQRGNESTAGYDAATGSLLHYQNPGDTASGPTVMNTIAYNPSGAPTKVTEGTGESTSLSTSLEYTGSGAYSQVEPSIVSTPFSAAGQKKSMTKTHKTFYGYDSSGNLTSARQDIEKEGEGQPEVKLTYNAQGQVTSSTDPEGHVTKYKYCEGSGHEKGDLLKIEAPAPLGTTEFTYDSLDRVHSVTDGRKNTATYIYDGEDRLTKVEYSDGSSVSFKFDADGNTTERVDAKGFGEPYTGATYYEYNKLNRPTLETTPSAKTTRYGYDYDGNLTSLEDAGGSVAYAYGSDDVLTSLTEPENAAHPFKFGYEAKTDNRESTTYPNGLLQCTKTDAVGRLSLLLVFKPTGEQNCSSTISASATLEDYALSYAFEEEFKNEKGEVETISIDTPELQKLSNLKAGNATTYSYETLDGLLKAVTKAGSEAASLTSEYEYDKAGNMLLDHTYSPSTTYTNEHMLYNGANEICAIATTTPSACAKPSEPGIAGQPTFDEDGNMTSDGLLSGANKFAYNVRDQVTSITPHGESAKQIVSHGTGQDDLAAIGSEEVITNILGVGVMGSGESAKYYTRGSEGMLLAKRTAKGKPSETEYYLQDPLGSIAMVTSSAGSQTSPSSGMYQYDPYGSPVGSAASTFGYQSGQALPTGLTHFGARYYDSTVGQWTQLDPLGGGYIYAGGNPINNGDPSGEGGEGSSDFLCVKIGALSINCEGAGFHLKLGLGPGKEIAIHGPGGLEDALKKCGEGAIAGPVANSAQKVAEGGASLKEAVNLRSAFYAAGIGCVVNQVSAT